MSNEGMPVVGGDELPEVDEVLAQALSAQGETGRRALSLLRDARRVLAGAGLERPWEVAESCLRGAMEALLKSPGAEEQDGRVGVGRAARGLLKAVDALPTPATPDSSAPKRPRPAAAAAAARKRVDAAAEVLRGELARKSGVHTVRALRIAERVMGVRLGTPQEEVLGGWTTVYRTASGTLHGDAAEEGRAARLYIEVMEMARELLVPLPERAERVLQLTVLPHPGPEHARELARWADPRAIAHFHRSRPAPAWLALLQEHAPHLLLPDTRGGGTWPAAPFFEHLADTVPEAAGAWLAAHAEDVAAAGRRALDAVLSLAGDRVGLMPPALVHALLRDRIAERPVGELPDQGEGWTLSLAATWACAVPVPDRDRAWVLVAERLLKSAVDAAHTAARFLDAVDAAHEEALAQTPPGPGLRRVFAGDPEIVRRWLHADIEQMPKDMPGVLLGEFVATAHPGGPGVGTHPSATTIRAVVAALLARDVDLTAPIDRRAAFREDLAQDRPGAPTAFGGHLLARAVLDLAAADADAGVSLAVRTAQWKKLTGVDEWLRERMWAAHLAARTPGACLHDDLHEDLHEASADSHDGPHEPTAAAHRSGPETREWHERAYALVPRLLAGRPDPEPARLVERVWRSCTPRATAELKTAARAALARPPKTQDLESTGREPAESPDGDGACGRRAREWSPLLPASLLADVQPLPAAPHRLTSRDSSGPRTAVRPQQAAPATVLEATGLIELAAARGPVAAARALAAAQDAGVDRHARLLDRLVSADRAAWTADIPAVLDALDLPALRAFYLAALGDEAGRPGALPDEALALAVAGALRLHDPASAGETPHRFAEAALFELLKEAWTRPAGPPCLGDLLPAVLDHLHTLAQPLTHTADEAPAGAEPVNPDTAGRALECLLDYAAALPLRTGAPFPGDVLELLETILATHPAHPAVSAAIGPRLLVLDVLAPGFTAAHHAALTSLDGPTPAAAWLNTGPADPPRLATLDRAALLASVRADTGGPVEHLAHALTTDPHLLGDPVGVLTKIAGGPGGPPAVSWLLQVMAWRLEPHNGDIGSRPFTLTRRAARPATEAELAAVTTVWRAALDAGLPSGALVGAGYFAALPFDDTVWLPLARASAEHTPPASPATAAWRAAAHPGDKDAFLLTTRLLTHPAAQWRIQDVLPPARTLFQAAQATTAHPDREPVAGLRRALIEAGALNVLQH
ncbi:hypothetical protein AB0E74_25640 [Streptomyces sp. NPDC030392]|uniref:hypothetical protein n=1 Tax=Streptomyces sp. NPDC030392 TaxID=3155468 RepID=UPI003400D51E